jgi:hypothetical protein
VFVQPRDLLDGEKRMLHRKFDEESSTRIIMIVKKPVIKAVIVRDRSVFPSPELFNSFHSANETLL